MIDRVRNPWRKRKGVIVFDIETPWGKIKRIRDKRRARFRCGVAYVYDDDAFYEFTKPSQFVALLKSAKTLVSYNGERFDFLVLGKYGLKTKKVTNPIPGLFNPFGHYFCENPWRYKRWLKSQNRWKPQRRGSCDIMHMAWEKRPIWNKDKKFPSLEEMIGQHCGKKKAKFNRKDKTQLLRHCREDVEYTKYLYEQRTWKVPILKQRGSIEGTGQIPRMVCPICYHKMVFVNKDSKTECWHCGAWAVVAPPDDSDSEKSKSRRRCRIGENYKGKLIALLPQPGRICENCEKQLMTIIWRHVGYGSTYGPIRRGRSACPVCRKGCYEWRNDSAPGFKERWRGTCCSCGKHIDAWKRKRVSTRPVKRVPTRSEALLTRA